jgi:TonB family protein
MSCRRRLVVAIGLVGLALAGCQEKIPTPTEVEAARTAGKAYHAYARGDCDRVRELTDPERLAVWPMGELRHSMLLLQGFCRELDGEIEGARDVYRELVLEAPTSFAADDAAERTRVLKLLEDDPAFAERLRKANRPPPPDRRRRTPVDRVPAAFPPLARAAGIAGYVVVDFRVTQSGTTEDPIVVDSEPPLLFDGSALRAVRKWEYLRESSSAGDDRQLIRIRFQPDGRPSQTDDEEPPTGETQPGRLPTAP